jgi:tetratricopeptide (TPR) repeat protein
MRNEVQGKERRRIVRHLLAGCAECVKVTRRLWSFSEGRGAPETGDAAVHPASYREVFERLSRDGWAGGRITAERREAPLLLNELLDRPRSTRLALVCVDARFQSPAVCELLLDQSRLAEDIAFAVEMGELAVAVAGQLDERLQGATLVRGLRVRAWSGLGNSRRLAGDLEGAETALTTAELLFEEEPGEPLESLEPLEPLEKAELLGLRACLLGEQGKLAEAERLLDRALATYRTAGERHLQGRTLIQKGAIHGWAENEKAALEAVQMLREGISLLDKRTDPRLAASALHRLAMHLVEAGRGEQALDVVHELRSTYEETGDSANLVRLRRLEGKIEEARGRLDAAEAALREAREGFLREGFSKEAALTQMELAIVYTRQERAAELLELAQDILPILRTRDIRQGTMAALLFVRRLAETGYASQRALYAVAGYLADHPHLRRPPLRWVS